MTEYNKELGTEYAGLLETIGNAYMARGMSPGQLCQDTLMFAAYMIGNGTPTQKGVINSVGICAKFFADHAHMAFADTHGFAPEGSA